MAGWYHRLDRHESDKLWEMVKDREAWHAAGHGVAKSWIQLSDRTELIPYWNKYHSLLGFELFIYCGSELVSI